MQAAVRILRVHSVDTVELHPMNGANALRFQYSTGIVGRRFDLRGGFELSTFGLLGEYECRVAGSENYHSSLHIF